jgi:hypothetical protein
VHTLSLGYELAGSTGNKLATNVFTKPDYLTETQKNIAFDDAGSFWAATEMSKPLSIDGLILKMLNSSQSETPTWATKPGYFPSSVKILAIPYWKTRVGSEANFEVLVREI